MDAKDGRATHAVHMNWRSHLDLGDRFSIFLYTCSGFGRKCCLICCLIICMFRCLHAHNQPQSGQARATGEAGRQKGPSVRPTWLSCACSATFASACCAALQIWLASCCTMHAALALLTRMGLGRELCMDLACITPVAPLALCSIAIVSQCATLGDGGSLSGWLRLIERPMLFAGRMGRMVCRAH